MAEATIQTATGRTRCRICKETILPNKEELVMDCGGIEHYHLMCIHNAGHDLQKNNEVLAYKIIKAIVKNTEGEMR